MSLALDAGLSYPVVRSRDKNLTLSGLFFLSNDEGDILAAPNSDDRLRGLRFKADFDVADATSATTQGNVTFSQGIDGLGSTQNGNPLASRANGRVDFTKIEGLISRTQPLAATGSRCTSRPRGNMPSRHCSPPNNAAMAARTFGRAFDPSEITGDSCWSVSGELRYDLPSTPLIAMSQLYAFVDYGRVYNIAPVRRHAGEPERIVGRASACGSATSTSAPTSPHQSR